MMGRATLLDRKLEIPVVIGSISELQQKILQHISTVNNANYRTLMKDIGKDRIMILQSVESPILQYHYYVYERKINPKYQESNLIFTLTH